MSYYNVYHNNYESYSRSQKLHAAKEYACCVTGRPIHKGDEYYKLECWNPVKNKRFTFHFDLSVSTKLRQFFRKYPEEAIEQFRLKAGWFVEESLPEGALKHD